MSRVRAAALGLLALPLVGGCGSGARQAPAWRDVRLDLTDALPVAEQHRAVARIRFDDPRSLQYLTSGWHGLERDADGRAFVWSSGRNAVVDLPLAARGPLRVRLQVEPYGPSPRLPDQELRVLWNGREAGSWPLSGGSRSASEGIEFAVPEANQRVGVNRLELMPSYWLRPRSFGDGDDARILGVRCRAIDLIGPAEASPDPPLVEAQGDGSILQRPGSVVTWYFPLPTAAVLRGALRLRDGAAAAAGDVSLGIVDRAGRERVLVAATAAGLAAGGDLAIEADLGALAGELAAVSAAFSGPGPGPRLEWRELRIEGREEWVAGPPGLRRGPYDVLAVLFDSLRADHTEPYAAGAARTPEMARLAAGGVTFVNAFANAPWTSASVASLFTSVYPRVHGLHSFAVAAHTPLPAGLPTLPEILRDAGYRTLMVTKNGYVSPSFGFGRGFEAVEALLGPRSSDDPAAEADAVWERSVEPFLAGDPERPFLVYLHELEPHSPYRPPPPFAAADDGGYRGNLDALGSLGAHAVLNSDPALLDRADLRHLDALYRGEIAWADRYLARLLERLEGSGRGARTLVVLLSDHGEAFREHALLGHGHTVYDEQLRVPLVLSLPGVLPAGRRPRVHAQLVDLAPTLLDLLGIPAPASLQGESLLPFAFADEGWERPRPVFAQGGTRHYDAVRFGRWKLVRDGTPGDPGDPAAYPRMRGFLLFDLASDPEEQVDRWPDEPIAGPALRQMMRWRNSSDAKRRAPAQAMDPARLTPELSENLQALGYAE